MKSAVIILLVAAVAALGSLLYAQHGLVNDQQQEIVELGAKIKTTETAASLSLQAQCSDQARKEFVFEGLDKQPLASFENHYNKKLNKCFIETYYNDASGGESRIVSDAFEGRVYGTYLWHTKKGKKYWEVPPMTCKVTSLTGVDEFCKSSDEFDALLKSYME